MESTIEKTFESGQKDFPRILIKGGCRIPEQVVIAAEQAVLFLVEHPGGIIEATLAQLATYLSLYV
jgi:hypothetical protein